MKCIFISILAILLYISSAGQLAFTNTGNLQIHTGVSVTGFGNFVNTSAAVLVNNANFYLKGNLANDQPAMSAGTGSLFLDGSSLQTVSGSQTFKTYNLITDNSNGITLNNNLSVTGTHTFSHGLIGTSATPNYLVYEAGSSYSGSNDSRHVTGWVKKNGNTAFVFPVGDAQYLRAAAISALSAVSEFNCHYYIPTQNIYNLLSPLVQVKGNEYWQLDKIAGGTAAVTLNWDHSKVPMDNVLLADILVGKYTSAKWSDAGGSGTATGVVTTTGSVSSGSQTSFGQVTLGYKTFPVPLRLISFTAERRPGISYLQWITDNEQSVSHFDVQRSYDARTFTTIGLVPARNSGVRDQYNFEDHAGLRGFAWYRIRSVDVDGKLTYTKIAVVSEIEGSANSFLVLNPVRSVITIVNRTGNNGIYEYRLFNAGGQLVLEGSVNMISNASVVLSLPEQVASGIYMLELSNERIQFRHKILVEK